VTAPSAVVLPVDITALGVGVGIIVACFTVVAAVGVAVAVGAGFAVAVGAGFAVAVGAGFVDCVEAARTVTVTVTVGLDELRYFVEPIYLT